METRIQILEAWEKAERRAQFWWGAEESWRGHTAAEAVAVHEAADAAAEAWGEAWNAAMIDGDIDAALAALERAAGLAREWGGDGDPERDATEMAMEVSGRRGKRQRGGADAARPEWVRIPAALFRGSWAAPWGEGRAIGAAEIVRDIERPEWRYLREAFADLAGRPVGGWKETALALRRVDDELPPGVDADVVIDGVMEVVAGRYAWRPEVADRLGLVV